MAEPLDVAACVRLLNEAADERAMRAAFRPYAHCVAAGPETAKDVAQLRALALALPGMGKDAERWRVLTLRVNHIEFRNRFDNGTYSLTRADDGPESDLFVQSRIAEEIDDIIIAEGAPSAARAAQPEETSATRCVICQKDGDYDEMVATYDGEPAHRSCRATVEPWSTATDGFCSTCGNPKHWQSLSPHCVGFHTPRAADAEGGRDARD